MDVDDFWDGLGLGPVERAVYRSLISVPVAPLTTRANQLGVAPAEVLAATQRLAELQLVYASEDGDDQEVLDPQIAVSSLARRRQAVLDRAPTYATGLLAEFTKARQHTMDEPRVRLLTAEKVTRLVIEALESASSTIDAFVAPPVATDAVSAAAEYEALRRGVRIRTILDPTSTDEPFLRGNLTTAQGLGEEVRTFPGLTLKALIIDQRVVIPVTTASESDGNIQAAIADFPGLTSIMKATFELIWAMASPFHPDSDSRVTLSAQRSDEQAVARLLRRGLSDATICRRLQISDRTLRRRIYQLQRTYHATSRFQLGAKMESERLQTEHPPANLT